MKKIINAIIIPLMMAGCMSHMDIELQNDPYYQDFYMTARFIMSDFEKQVYKFLPSVEAKQEFIENFWKRRDPTPETDINENKEEFESRINFANKWFNEGKRAKGWDTERGRILLQLGFPDSRNLENPQAYNSLSRAYSSKRINIEYWYYVRYDIGLIFVDLNETGRFRIYNPPPGLLSAIEQAIAAFDLVKLSKSDRTLKYKSNYKDNILTISVPAKNVYFVEENDKMMAEFNILVIVYYNYKEIDKIEKSEKISLEGEKLLKQDNLVFTIPYTPEKKGLYYFEIILDDIQNQSKYRSYIREKM